MSSNSSKKSDSFTFPKNERKFAWIKNFAFPGSNQPPNAENELPLPLHLPREQRSPSVSTIQLGETSNERRESGAILYTPQTPATSGSSHDSIKSLLRRNDGFVGNAVNNSGTNLQAGESFVVQIDDDLYVQPQDNSLETSGENTKFYCSPPGAPSASVSQGVVMGGVLLGAAVLHRFQEKEVAPAEAVQEEVEPSTSGAASTSRPSGLQKKADHVVIEMLESNEPFIGKIEAAQETVTGYIPVSIGVILGGVLLGGVVLRENEQRDVESGQSDDGEGQQEDDGEGDQEKDKADEECDPTVEQLENATEGKTEDICEEENEEDNTHEGKAEGRQQEGLEVQQQNGSLVEQSESNLAVEEHHDQQVAVAYPPQNGVPIPVQNLSEQADNDIGTVKVKAGDIELLVHGPVKSLKEYFDMMYCFGVSAYKPLEKPKLETCIDWIIYAIQKGFFVYVVGTSMEQSFFLGKYSVLAFATAKGDARYGFLFNAGVNFAWLVSKVYMTYVLSFQKVKTNSMLKAMEEYREKCYVERKSTGSRIVSWMLKLVAILAIASLIIAGMDALFGDDYGVTEELLLESSNEMSRDLFIWSSKNLTESIIKLRASYGKKLTKTTIAFGSAVILRDVASYLQLGMLFDVVALIGAVCYLFVDGFMKEVKECTPNIPIENVEEWTKLQKKREKLWLKYRLLMAVNFTVNDFLDPLLKVQHLGNLLMYAFFMTLIISNSTWLAFFLYAIYIFKAEIAYIIAGKLSEANDGIRDWIRNWAWEDGKIHVGDKVIDAAMALDELDKHPIGFGRGKFLIHETFHYKFWGLVGSVFFSMADDE